MKGRYIKQSKCPFRAADMHVDEFHSHPHSFAYLYDDVFHTSPSFTSSLTVPGCFLALLYVPQTIQMPKECSIDTNSERLPIMIVLVEIFEVT